MSSTAFSLPLLQSPFVKPIAAMLLVVFLVLLIISAVYFVLSYLGESSNECEELRVKEDKAATRKAFSVVAVVSVIGLIICGVVLRGARLNDDGGIVLRGGEYEADGKAQGTTNREVIRERYSSDELIELYNNLPKNAIIHCDLEVEGKFEECTVLKRPKVDLKNTGAAHALGSIIDPILKNKKHLTAKCCTDTAKSTFMFTTMAINEEVEVDSTGITMKDCLDTECTDHVLAKIARNQLYQKMFSADIDGCKDKTSVNKSGCWVKHTIHGRYMGSIFRSIELECPDAYNLYRYPYQREFMLYRYTFSKPLHKLDRVNAGSHLENYKLDATFNCEQEDMELRVLTLILTEWDNYLSMIRSRRQSQN